MKVPTVVYRSLAWLNLPAALLIALLQRTPVLRVVAGAGEHVLRSPLGQLLRNATTVAALGGVHSLAGATTFIINRANPISGTVGQAIESVTFTYSGTPSSPASFRITDGSLPPGLSFVPAPTNGTIRSGTPVISGTPTQAGSFTVSVQGFNAEGLTNSISQDIMFVITGGVTTVAPAISTQPQAQTVTAGASVTLSVTATGEPAPQYQWRKDGTAISGATSASLTLTNVQTSATGSYSVVVSNSAGSVTSSTATLTVNPPATSVAITHHPAAQTVAMGSTVVFSVGATGATGYQWRREGAAISGATGATLVIESATTASAGSYTVLVSGNGGAPAASNAAALAVNNEPNNFGRLINLSILTSIPTAGANFTMGYVVGGAGTSGAKALVIRAAGPSLGALGVPGTLENPKIELFAGTAKTDENDNWGGSATLANALTAVGAFGYISATSLDSAVSTTVAKGDNSVIVSASGSGTGTVIAEVYDATPGASFSATTPRLVNVSVSKVLDATGANSRLTAGFVIGGATSRTLLIRAVGPGLAAVGLTSGFAPDPQLALFAGSTKTLENDNWGGDVQVAATASRVGAFGVPAGSKDAVLLVTLPPGQYSAEVSAVGGGGLALVEVYEVP